MKGSLPDCMVVFGVDAAAIVARNGYVIREVGKPPDLVLEVGSSSKGWQDYTVKHDDYLDYGVSEYWRFDHTGGRYHVSGLAVGSGRGHRPRNRRLSRNRPPGCS